MLQVGCICGLMAYLIIHSIIIQLLYVSGKRTFGRMTHVIFHSIIMQLLYVTGVPYVWYDDSCYISFYHNAIAVCYRCAVYVV